MKIEAQQNLHIVRDPSSKEDECFSAEGYLLLGDQQ
jgi:hypothetical protein